MLPADHSRWDKFLPYKSFITCFNNRLHDSRIMELLCIINLISARNTAGMIVRNVFMVVPVGLDDIHFYYPNEIVYVDQLNMICIDYYATINSLGYII